MTDANPDLWRQTIRSRLLVVAVAFLAWVAVIEARLAYLQIYRHEYYMTRAEQQQSDTITVPAPRGDLLDRNGRVLAYSVPAYSAFIVPKEVPEGDRARVIDAICTALPPCDRSFKEGLAERMRKSRSFAWVRRRLWPGEKQRLVDLKIKAIGFEKESRRYYPNEEVASHVLGYVGLDNLGLGGIERSYDRFIAGTPGASIVQTDARHNVFSRAERPPAPGASVELTIDRNIQYIAERELAAAIKEHRAAGGTVIVMDPMTAEVLAMASLPTFNPNRVGDADKAALRNRAVEDVYEPGSTFKTVTASAAIEEGIVRPDDVFDTNPGYIRIGNWRVVRDTHRNGVLSFTQGIIKSSNVLAIKVGFKVGGDRLARYVRRFGFGQRLLPDVGPQSQSAGIVWQKYDESTLASVSMGYQVGVTPLQMVTAVSSVANGGHLMEPHVVRAVIRNGQRTAIPPKELRRTISESTAATLTTIMEGVVAEGTGKTARIDGYTIAGKTGTAAKLIDGVYSKQKYNASFVGFFPSRKPRYTILVVIDSPSTGPYYGGLVAAPAFKKIGEALVALEGIPKSIGAPDTVLVSRTIDSPARPARQTTRDILPASGRSDTLPDLRGLSMREAVRTLVSLGVRGRISGDGIVIEQSPEAGTPLSDTQQCHLTLARVPPDPAPAPVEETEERP